MRVESVGRMVELGGGSVGWLTGIIFPLLSSPGAQPSESFCQFLLSDPELRVLRYFLSIAAIIIISKISEKS